MNEWFGFRRQLPMEQKHARRTAEVERQQLQRHGPKGLPAKLSAQDHRQATAQQVVKRCWSPAWEMVQSHRSHQSKPLEGPYLHIEANFQKCLDRHQDQPFFCCFCWARLRQRAWQSPLPSPRGQLQEFSQWHSAGPEFQLWRGESPRLQPELRQQKQQQLLNWHLPSQALRPLVGRCSCTKGSSIPTRHLWPMGDCLSHASAEQSLLESRLWRPHLEEVQAEARDSHLPMCSRVLGKN